MRVLKCPNDDKHRRFSATSHVAETWEVDEHGEFITVGSSEVVAGPDFNCSVCLECGAEAEELRSTMDGEIEQQIATGGGSRPPLLRTGRAK